MSLPDPVEIKCPKCGKTSEVTIFHSINSQWTDAAQQIITGELFLFTCPHCGRKDHLEQDILFNEYIHSAGSRLFKIPI